MISQVEINANLSVIDKRHYWTVFIFDDEEEFYVSKTEHPSLDDALSFAQKFSTKSEKGNK